MLQVIQDPVPIEAARVMSAESEGPPQGRLHRAPGEGRALVEADRPNNFPTRASFDAKTALRSGVVIYRLKPGLQRVATSSLSKAAGEYQELQQTVIMRVGDDRSQ